MYSEQKITEYFLLLFEAIDWISLSQREFFLVHLMFTQGLKTSAEYFQTPVVVQKILATGQNVSHRPHVSSNFRPNC